jgi:hypothetical protein
MRIRSILSLTVLSLTTLSACAAHHSTNVHPPTPLPIISRYIIQSGTNPDWTLGCDHSDKTDPNIAGADAIGQYIQTTIHAQSQGVPLTETIRTYQNRPVSLFSVRYDAPAPHPVVVFPDFNHLPANLHIMSYRERVFSPVAFSPMDSGSPWLIFDDAGNAFIISPASHFLIQTIGGDAKNHIASQLRETVTNIPAGFTQQTLVASGSSINRTWDEWGRALTDLQGKSRPANDADTGLKYLGYWTDNGAHYYYNYDPTLGYGATLLKLEKHFQDAQIPVKYMQLDSWWYYKTFSGPDGKIGKTKNARLPEGEWNRYGGLLEYRSHPAVLPDGLEAFHKELGLPLITHNRWIDPASPYHQKYQITGYAAIDPGFWNEIMSYISAAGVQTYEQDWLIDIYNHSPEMKSTITAGDAFADGMAHAAAGKNMTVQYCMAVPGFFLQGSKYPNLTTIRCSDDRFNPERWLNFLYASRLASAVGIWPWADTYMTSETGNILLSDLSAGMVGFGDEMGRENTTNIFHAVRKDGVIVKPDAAIVPIDSDYIAEAKGEHRAVVASTYTDHDGIRTEYVFAFRPPAPHKSGKNASTQPDINESRFSLADIGVTGRAYIYDFLTQEVRYIEPDSDFVSPLGKDGFNYFIVAQPGISGIALFGDAEKFVSNGRQRVATITENPSGLDVELIFAQSENNVRLHGCSQSPIRARVGYQLLDTHFNSSSHYFYIDVDAKWLAGQPTGADGTRHLVVTLLKD